MHITYIGLGYVGLVHSVLLASFGNDVIGYDIDKEKINLLRQGVSTLEEPNLQTLLTEAKGKISFTSNAHDAIANQHVFFIAVDTPVDKNGDSDLTQIYDAIDKIAEFANKESYIIIRSIVPVGTCSNIEKYLAEKSKVTFHVLCFPEFGREGFMVYDMLNPSRLVVGIKEDKYIPFIKSFYDSFLAKKVPLLFTTLETAEMIKLANGAMIATKISFVAGLSRLCEKVGADIDKVVLGMSLDPRIGGACMKPGIGYGGPSLNTCIDSLTKISDDNAESLGILKSAKEDTANQVDYFLRKIFQRFHAVSSKTIAVLGASYKGGTEDVRNSASVEICKFLLNKGAELRVYDSLALDNILPIFSRHKHITYCDYIDQAFKGADFCIILNDSKEFSKLTVQDFKKMRRPIVIDGHNLFKVEDMKEIEYHSIGHHCERKY